MHDAPRYDPYEKSSFLPNNSSAQPLVAGTVSRTAAAGVALNEDELLHTGKINGQVADVFPFAISHADLDRGQERFNIYCSPCHSPLGDGNGTVVQRGYKRPSSFHEQRLRDMGIGYFYDVISNGFGQMPDYAAQVAPADRWAIAAYIRVLQRSQTGTIQDVPAEHRGELDGKAPAAPEASHGGGAAHD